MKRPSTLVEPRDPLLFIGGCMRSGTTLLRNMLSRHPLVAVPDESYFIYEAKDALSAAGRPSDTGMALALIRESRFFRNWELDPETLELYLSRFPPATYAALIRVLLSAYAYSRDKPFSADKTPHHVLHFDWLASQFPASRYVHLVRDPREVCMSSVLQLWVRLNIRTAAEDWTRSVVAARRAKQVLGERLLEVRYERLVSDPEVELGRICDHAGIEYSEELLDHTHLSERPAGHHHSSSTRPVTRGLRSWEHELSADDVSLIEAIAGEAMEEMGYERAALGLTARARLATLQGRAADIARRSALTAAALASASRRSGSRT